MKQELSHILQDKRIRILVMIQVVFSIIYSIGNLNNFITLNNLRVFLYGISSVVVFVIIISEKSNYYELSKKKYNTFLVFYGLRYVCCFSTIDIISIGIIDNLLSATGIIFLIIFNFLGKNASNINMRIVIKVYCLSLLLYLIWRIFAEFTEITKFFRNNLVIIKGNFDKALMAVLIIIYCVVEAYILPYLILKWINTNKESGKE